VKVGDMVRVISSAEEKEIGVIVCKVPYNSTWWEVLLPDNTMVIWPENQLEIISGTHES